MTRMNILLTADLHSKQLRYLWLENAANYDLICIAGDLPDLFNAADPKSQVT
jgi:Icc-related predicted phosphoesterase